MRNRKSGPITPFSLFQRRRHALTEEALLEILPANTHVDVRLRITQGVTDFGSGIFATRRVRRATPIAHLKAMPKEGPLFRAQTTRRYSPTPSIHFPLPVRGDYANRL
jgi:hypothetical protein